MKFLTGWPWAASDEDVQSPLRSLLEQCGKAAQALKGSSPPSQEELIVCICPLFLFGKSHVRVAVGEHRWGKSVCLEFGSKTSSQRKARGFLDWPVATRAKLGALKPLCMEGRSP